MHKIKLMCINCHVFKKNISNEDVVGNKELLTKVPIRSSIGTTETIKQSKNTENSNY